jgi:hypothetical protein
MPEYQILDDPEMVGPRPAIAVLAEGERFDAATGTSTGTSLFLIFFPKLGRTMGLKLKIIANYTDHPRFEVGITPLEKSSLAVTEALHRLP